MTTLRLSALGTPPRGVRPLAAKNSDGVHELVASARKKMRLFDTLGYEEAVSLIQQALDQSQNFSPAHAALAETYSYWGFRREISSLEADSFYNLAYRHAQTAMRLSPERSDAHRGMAVALRNGENADPARRKEEILTAMDLDPNDAMNWYEYWRAFGYNPSDPAVRRIQELDSTLIGFFIDMGVVLCEQERHQESLRYLEKALKLNPENSLALYNTAMVLDRHGWRKQAVKVISKASLLFPDDELILAGAALVGGGVQAHV